MVLRLEIGIRQLDSQSTINHREFISKSTSLINEVKDHKNELQETIQDKENKSQQLISETHTAYETGYLVLQYTIKGLRRSLIAKESVDEILCLTTGIYETLFNLDMSTNKEVSAQMATQFNTTFQKLHQLKAWFEEKMEPASSKGEVIQIRE